MALFIPFGATLVGGGATFFAYLYTFQTAQEYGLQGRQTTSNPVQKPSGSYVLSIGTGAVAFTVLKLGVLDRLVPKQTKPQDIRHFRQFLAIVGPRYECYTR
jgi:hypothetical protein